MDGLFALTAVAATDTEIFRENINSLTEKEQERLCRANQLGENQMTNNTLLDCGISKERMLTDERIQEIADAMIEAGNQ